MRYTIAVRALCEFTAKCGDLDLRFTPSPTGLQGIAGHHAVAARRGADYQTELAVSGDYRELTVRGRLDGFDAAANRLDEIKTYRGRLEAVPAQHRLLHRAQANVYGALLCAERGLPGLTIAVVYFDIDREQETSFPEYRTAAELQQFFEQQCAAFLAWAEAELAHRAARDSALAALRFPHGEFRLGQRRLAESVYKAVCTAQPLLAQAPTGIGKTVATLFPALKATATQQLDKVFFLAAKTTGRALALAALRTLDTAATVRVLELTARDKSCEHPDKMCHGESCPLARGFYDRLPAARAAAARHGWLDREALRGIAAEHAVCPYYLAQEMARWSDVVVADYNYFFDGSALLFGLTLAGEWKVTALVDEAHSLVERARAMYSAELDHADFIALKRTAPAELRKPLERLQRSWSTLAGAQQESYRRYDEPPRALLDALRNAVAAIGDFQVEQPTRLDASLQQFYFDALHFCRSAEALDDHSLFDGTLRSRGRHARLALCVRNVIPARFLAPRFAGAHATILFSATLSPWNYYREMLGLPAQTPWLDVESPFAAEQLDVRIAGVSTRFQRRTDSIAPIAELIGQQYRRCPGNYLAFFSSFDYLEQVAAAFRERCADIPTWSQQRRMDEAGRTGFIERFTAEGSGIGFAVLGGAFGEGIDLPGKRLIGAFIATLGLPQVNPVNELMMERIGALFGTRQAYDYTYLIPGIRKVAQAAGRIIRTVDDRGTLFLIDERFAQPRVQRLLPAWWNIPAQPALPVDA